MDSLVLQNLSKRFNNVWAVRNLNLNLKSGEIFVLLGPNGAGKTTTLKLIAGLLKPTAGEIYIKNIDLKKEPERAKSMLGFVPDEPFIYNKLTGREFINFVASIFGVKREDYEKKLPALLERFEIGDWIDQPSETYSHGMKQKVIMCQLLLHNPEVILIDEPLVGLDPKVSRTVRETFIQLMNEGKTLLVSTHTLSFAFEIATRIGIINFGELKFVGTVDELSRIAGEKDIEEIYLKLSQTP
ncbi:MAG: ABC transporter ATP-binding protein [candidate division WOR-3 bacterium]